MTSSSKSVSVENHGLTALHFAAKKGQLETVERLLGDGADVGARSTSMFPEAGLWLYSGSTPLHVASVHGKLDVVRALLNHKAAVDARDEHGQTALHCASTHGHASIVECLLVHGADVRVTDRESKFSALHNCAANGHVKVAEILCAFGSDVEQASWNGSTALMLAVTTRRLNSLRLLLALNADVTHRNSAGWSVSQTPNSEIQELLLQHQAQSDAERERMRVETINRIRSEVGARIMASNAHQVIVGICLALSSLELPPYVVLWIIDWLPGYALAPHRKKIQLIESVRSSVWKIKKVAETV